MLRNVSAVCGRAAAGSPQLGEMHSVWWGVTEQFVWVDAYCVPGHHSCCCMTRMQWVLETTIGYGLQVLRDPRESSTQAMHLWDKMLPGVLFQSLFGGGGSAQQR